MADNYKNSKFMTDAILDNLQSIGVAPNAQTSNLMRSGQLGSGIRFTTLDGATPAVFNPVVGVVLSVPSMWDRWPKLQEMLVAIMETHAKSITGIDFGYTLETQDVQVGHDGQTMKVPTRTTRSGVNPSVTVQEYPGMPVWNLMRTWMFHIQHPDTNASILPAEILWGGNQSNLGSQIPAWFMSAYSMSMIFIQYDPTQLPDRIYDAAVITNMFPTEIGEIGFERTIGTTKLIERSINFSGIVQHNENTRALGVSVAKLLELHKINYNHALPGLAGTADAARLIGGQDSNFTDISKYGLRQQVGNTTIGINGDLQNFNYKGGTASGGSDDQAAFADRYFTANKGEEQKHEAYNTNGLNDSVADNSGTRQSLT